MSAQSPCSAAHFLSAIPVRLLPNRRYLDVLRGLMFSGEHRAATSFLRYGNSIDVKEMRGEWRGVNEDD